MRGLKTMIRTVAHRFGVELSRYPREDQLIQQWIGQIRKGGPLECVFDIGANRGQTVTRFRSWFPDSTIYAFEPAAAAYAELARATSIDPRARPFRLALGERDGSAVLHENAADVTNSLLANAAGVDRFTPVDMYRPVAESAVPLARLDTFCAREGIAHIDLLKIDAQGYERRILEGAGSLLAPEFIRGILLEVLFVDLYQGQAWGGELLEMMRMRGYKLFGFTEIAFDHKHGWKWADAMFLPDHNGRGGETGRD